MNSSLKGFLLLFFADFLWALEGIGVNAAPSFFPTITIPDILFWNLLGGCLAAAPFFLRSQEKQKETFSFARSHWKIVLLVSALTTLGISLIYWGILHSNAGTSALLESSNILFATFLGVWLLQERFTTGEGLGAILALLGFLFIVGLPDVHFQTACSVMLGAFCYSLQSFIVKKYLPGVDAPLFSFLRIIFMFLLFTPIFLVLSENIFPEISLILFCAGLGVIGTFLALVFFFQAHNLLPIGKLSLMMFLEPVLVLLLSIPLLHDTISLQKAIGAVCILGGLAIVMRLHIENEGEETVLPRVPILLLRE